eukprot:2209166-Karenia_brevis.AAC.1
MDPVVAVEMYKVLVDIPVDVGDADLPSQGLILVWEHVEDRVSLKPFFRRCISSGGNVELMIIGLQTIV